MIAVNVLKTTGFLHVDVVNEVKMIDIVVDLVKKTRVVGCPVNENYRLADCGLYQVKMVDFVLDEKT